MANPASRVQLKEYCLRRLGHPVIEINIDEDQMQDRIDDASVSYTHLTLPTSDLV